jgi:hypothetical protein
MSAVSLIGKVSTDLLSNLMRNFRDSRGRRLATRKRKAMDDGGLDPGSADVYRKDLRLIDLLPKNVAFQLLVSACLRTHKRRKGVPQEAVSIVACTFKAQYTSS